MAFTRSAGGSGGTELASGYISLSVHYNSAMAQISRDFTGLETQAAVSGEKAAVALSDSFGKRMGVDMAAQGRYALNTAGIDMERRANQVGATVGTAIGRAIGAPLGLLTNVFRKTADDGGKALRDGLTKHVEELTQSNLTLRQSVLDAGTAYQKLKSTAGTPVAELTASHERLVNLQHQSRQGVLDLAAAHQQLRSAAVPAVEEASSKFKELKSSIAESTEVVGALGLEAESVTGKVGSVGGALIALATNPLTAVAAVGAAVIGITTALYEMGETWEHTFHQIEISTGATGEKLEGLENNIKRVVGTVPQSIASVGQVTSFVATRFKDSGAGISQVTRAIEEMQSMFGTLDLQKLGRAFNAFGEGGKPQEQIDLLSQLGAAAQATQTPVNDLVGILAKSPGALKEFHLSMAESVSLLSEFDKSGVDPKTVQFTLSRAATLAGKAGKDLNVALTDALNQVKTEIDTKGQDAGEALAAKLFGPTSARGGGGTIVTALLAGFDPNVIKDWATKGGIDIDGLYQKTKEFSQIWGELKGQIANALEPIAVPVFKTIEGAFTRIATWIEAHKDELPQMFVNAAVQVEKFAATTLKSLADVGDAVASVMSGMGQMFGDDSLVKAANDIRTADSAMRDMSNDITKAGGVVDSTKAFGENLKTTTELTKALGDGVATVNAHGGLDITDATPEAIQHLKDLGLNLRQIGNDPTHIEILPDTPEAVKIINAMREEQGKKPLVIGIDGKVNQQSIGNAVTSMADYFKANPVEVPLVGKAQVSGTASSSGGAQPNLPGGNIFQPPNGDYQIFTPPSWEIPGKWGWADGGIRSYGQGGLPSSATIQSGVQPRGLVQWAEPSTGGEAFIPLSSSNRQRSLDIWGQTGKLLGVKGFDAGGISGADPRQTKSGVLQVIYANPATGQKTGEAGGQMVGPGTSQPGYYSKDWGGHTGHVHTSFATGLGGQPYGLPKGSDIRQGASGFPAWVYSLGREFGLEASTYPGHQEASGLNRGIDWWPAKHADMSGASYSPAERNKLQSFATYVSGVASNAMWGTQQGVRAIVGNRPNEVNTGGSPGFLSGSDGIGGGFGGMGGGRGFGGGMGFPTGTGFGGGGGGISDTVGGTGGGSGASPSGNDPVSAIVAEGRARGYSDTDLAWIVADAKGESDLDPNNVNASGHKGLFQQDSGYAGRDTMQGQITGFFDRLDATSPSLSIGDRISRSPAQGGVEGGGYGPDWIARNLSFATNAVAGVGGTNALGSLSPAQQQANEAAIAAGDAKIRKLQGDLDVANQQLQEAQDKPLSKGKKAQETHDAAITTVQDRIDKIQNDLKGAQTDRDNMDDLSSGDPKILVAAQNRVTDALTRQSDAQATLDKARADPATKPSEITKDTNALASATDAVTAAQSRLGDVQTKLQTPKKGKRTVTNPDGTTTTVSGGSSGLPDFGALADIGVKGITESFLPPGFTNPLDNPILKGVGGVLKFLSGLGSKHGGPLGGTTGNVLGALGGFAGGDISGGFNSLLKSFTAQPTTITAGSPGSAPYSDPTGLFSGSGSIANINAGDLPGLNTVFPQGSPASGTGSGALPGPQAPGPSQGGGPGIVNDFRGSNFQGDPAGVKNTLQDQHLAYNRKYGNAPQRNDMPGAH